MAIVQEPTHDVTVTAESGSDVGDVSQWRLMWRRFKQSKLAVGGGIILLVMYAIALFAPFLSPNEPNQVDSDAANIQPSKLTWNGGLAICGQSQKLNQETFTWEYTIDCNKPTAIQWFGHGHEYKMFGLIPTDRHLVTAPKPAKLYLWGGDEEGRDVFSRALTGARVSLTIGMFGVGIATIIAAVVGTISGYFGGLVDNVLQRIIEVILSVPTLPLWATMAAVLPRDMSVTKRYFLITVILSLVAWAGLARQVRGKVMAYSGADYVAAARAAGSGHSRIILTHMVPNSVSHLVVVTMLAIPGTIIAETSLSFLGIGMLPPAISWGVLLQDAQKVQVVTQYPWLLIPAVMVVLAVTCFQLLGDGVRDAVDPYG